MKNFIRTIKGDLWIILLDIISVNSAYFLALIIRFFVGGKFYKSLSELPYIYSKFAPFYTIICLIVFYIFRLYGGMWRYAGISDINRIIGASVVTSIIQIVGTLLFIYRMPLTFYFIGAALQFFFVTVTRFAYRFAVIERRRLGKKNANALIIGAEESGRYVIGLLDGGMAYRPACIVDDHYSGMSMDGLPVYGLNELEKVVEKHNIKLVVFANPELPVETRNTVTRVCSENNLVFRDYSSYFTFTGESEEVAVVGPTKASGRKTIPFSPPDIGEAEIEEVDEALRSGWITTGPRTKLLERRLAAYIETGDTGVDTENEPAKWSNKVVCLNSATAAEELNLRILGIGPGDEVIVPAYTYTATASAAIHCGATVKFIDIQRDGDSVTHMPEMDYEKLEEAITERTKAIVVVDLGGIVADYDRIFKIVEKKKVLFKPMNNDGNLLSNLSSRIQKGIGTVAVLSDCAHGLGASRTVSQAGEGKLTMPEKRYCGRIAHFTSFSFHAVKNFTTAEGGASTWCLPFTVYDSGITDEEIYKFYQLLSLHGQNKDALAKTKVGAWEYDIIGPWYKCNMTDIMAAIGLRQLDRYPGLLDRREKIIKRYDAVCDELKLEHLIHHIQGMDSSNHLYLVRIPGADEGKRNKVIEEMAKAGVSTNVHYKPLPMMTAYRDANIDNFPNAYDYYKNLFTLPLHTLLSDEDVEMVCNVLQTVIKQC